MSMTLDQYQSVSETLKTIAHPLRLMILCQLAESSRTVSELETLCDCSQSQVSQFLNRMRREKIVAANRIGRNVHYEISNPSVAELIQAMHKIFCSPTTTKKSKNKKKDTP